MTIVRSIRTQHDRLEVEKRVENGGQVKTADISRLMEILQSSLLAYWDFEPMSKAERERRKKEAEEKDKEGKPATATSSDKPQQSVTNSIMTDPTEARMRAGAVPKPEREDKKTLVEARSLGEEQKQDSDGQQKTDSPTEGEEPKPRSKKIPVIFIDEVSRLASL